MSRSYDYMAAEHIDSEDVRRLRDAWAHLTLLATGEKPATSNAEAACLLAEAYSNIMGQEITDPLDND